jgi:hypothetical protein
MSTFGDVDGTEQALREVARRARFVAGELRALDRAVEEARATSASWASIGHAVGISRQGAYKRWGASLDGAAPVPAQLEQFEYELDHEATVREQRAAAARGRLS